MKLEAECIQSIGEAREEGKKESKLEVLTEVKAELQGVFNRGFWDGWKLALKKAKVPSSSDWFLRDKTPLPFPEAGLKNSNVEDEDKAEEVGGEQDNAPGLSTPAPENNVPDPSGPASVDLAHQSQN